MAKKKELLTCRDVLWYLVFCGFAVNYVLRINLNLTIVAMVLPYPKPAAIAQCNVQENSTAFWTNETFPDNNVSFPSPDTTNENITYEDRFAWNEYQQGLALGAYYWLHWLSQLPGGLLARRYGTKLVFGLGNLLTALLGFLIPYATHLYALITLRALQGLIAGVIWPSMHDMTAKWIPPSERSRFVSAYLGERSCADRFHRKLTKEASVVSIRIPPRFRRINLQGVPWASPLLIPCAQLSAVLSAGAHLSM